MYTVPLNTILSFNTNEKKEKLKSIRCGVSQKFTKITFIWERHTIYIC